MWFSRGLAAAALLVIASAAWAQSAAAPYDPRRAFAESDTDHDGAVDRGELYDRSVEVFYHADANKDGFLSVEESARLPHRDDVAAGDGNRDGRLSVDEYVRVRDVEFEGADGDKNGVLSVDEVVEAYQGGGR